MSEYTAEDFKNARFAEHRYGAKAVRWGMNYRVPWHTVIGDRFSDEQMAESGWRPIVEVEDPEAIVALIGRQAMRIRELEGGREAAPLTLGALEAAFNAAEIPTGDNPPRKGDTIIEFDSSPCYRVTVVGCDWGGLTRYDSAFVRILSRASQREPWQDLADILLEDRMVFEEDVEGIVKRLHERGVRVTGGDES